LNRFWRQAVLEAGRTRASWCFLFNGTHLRLIRPDRLYSRRFSELDLDIAANDDLATAALRALFGADALGSAPGSPGTLTALLAEADRYTVTVGRELRTGVLEASGHVLGALALRDRRRPLADLAEQAFTIVFRLLFMLFAEARGLVPMWHPVYRASYSIDALRQASMEPRAVGLWDALRASARLAHAGCRAGTLKVAAFNGRLFAPARTPLAERRDLDDEAARRAIVAVSTRPSADAEGRQPIAYRDLGVEELGAVYETLLDYSPQEAPTPPSSRHRVRTVTLRPGSGVRKATGTFYTPRSLTEYVLREALAPLVTNAAPDQVLSLKVLDPSMGSGAFLVGACRYLADAYEHALVETGRCRPGDLGPAERASIRRTIAERCLYGVDINPAAVQLARLSLWLTTLAADRPLTFLDHHLRVGDSLAGTWLSRLRHAPRRTRAGRERPLLADDGSVADAVRGLLPVWFELSHDPSDTAAQVHAKERTLSLLTSEGAPLRKWIRVADAWCSAWFGHPPIPAAAFGALSDALLAGGGPLPKTSADHLLDRVADTAERTRLFHWELEFPEVFFDPDGNPSPAGGFDAIVGNPPWDMVRADRPEPRSGPHRDGTALVRFARDSGAYASHGGGQVNLYQLFVDRAISLTRPAGRMGLVLPAGVMSDGGSAGLRRRLFSACDVQQVVGFTNRSGLFPIHRSVRFVLLSAVAGRPTSEIACRFGESDPAALEAATGDDGRIPRDWFSTRVSTRLLETISGTGMAVPDARSGRDLAILEHAATLFAPVGSTDGWDATFGRELNATGHRRWFHRNASGFAVLEGKMIEPFRTRAELARTWIDPDAAARLLGPRCLRPRLAYRDVAGSTNRVTLIAAILPARTVSTHTLFCLKTALTLSRQRILCALYNSLVVNFLVRLRVTTHVTTAIVERLPVPREDQLGPIASELDGLAAVLASEHEQSAFVRLNALAARVYHLSSADFAHVLDTFPLVDRGERAAMLECFRRL
jgi:hypothetical protein